MVAMVQVCVSHSSQPSQAPYGKDVEANCGFSELTRLFVPAESTFHNCDAYERVELHVSALLMPQHSRDSI